MIKNYVVTSKKWVDRGGGKGFGYKHSKVTKYRCMGQSVANNHDVGNLCNVYGLNTNLKRESSQTTISMITTSVYISRDHFVAKS